MRSALILAAFALTAFTAPLPVDEEQGTTINERNVGLNYRDTEVDPTMNFYNRREPEPANVRFNNKREPEPANVRFNNKREPEPANVRFNDKREEKMGAGAEIYNRSSDGLEHTAELDFVDKES